MIMKRYAQAVLAVAGLLSATLIATAGAETKRLHPGPSHLSSANVAGTNTPQTTGTRRRNARRRRRSSAAQSNKPATSGAATHQIPSASASQGPLSQVTYELPLRKPGVGEQRVQGLLTDVACDARGVTFKITAGDKALRFWTPDLTRIHFATYTPEVSGEIVCGVRRPANMVVVVFRPAKAAGAKYDGTPISVEFVPKNFK